MSTLDTTYTNRTFGEALTMLPTAATALPIGFNDAVLRPRLLLLVSPTCPLCLSGVDLVLDGLETHDVRNLDVHVTWLPILEADTGRAADAVASSIEDRRQMTQYWDVDRVVSAGAHHVLEFASRRRKIAWDLYLFYGPGAEWNAPFPLPDLWLHQLDIADQPSLEATTLGDAIDRFERGVAPTRGRESGGR